MTERRVLALVIAAAALGLALCASASAAIVTVGSPLTQSFETAEIDGRITLANRKLTEAGARTTSPIAGAVIRWHVLGAEGGPFKLRVLRPSYGSGSYTGVGTSAGEVPAGLGLQTFSTALPVKSGDLIAVDNSQSAGDLIGYSESALGAELAIWDPPLAGSPEAPTEFEPGEVAFNAEVLPPPKITAVSPGSASIAGGASVVITGSNFERTSSVTFGNVSALSFTVDSESQITAVVPPPQSPTVPRFDVRVSVTTPAGVATTARRAFQYAACRVPSLYGVKLKQARNRLRESGCALGRVRKGKGVTAKLGRVVMQSREPHAVVAPGAKVIIRLKLFRDEGCIVPRLYGMPLKKAKVALRTARCRIGRVKKRKGVTARSGWVFRQRPRPGRSLPPRSKVSVGLRR